MNGITPCLWFDTQAEEAAAFYTSVFENSRVLGVSHFGEAGPRGWLKDRFGVSWQIIPTRLMELINDADQGRSQRAMQAMLEMNKIDIAAVEAAAGSET